MTATDGRSRDHQFRPVNPLQPAEPRRELPQFPRRAAEHDHLQTAVVVQMHVHGGHDPLGVVVLQVEKFLGQCVL